MSVLIAGVDEAGRGPLAGSVVAAAVILDPSQPIEGLDDSKKLTALRREKLAIAIKHYAQCWAIAEATVAEIEQLNILHATMLAMTRAVIALSIKPAHALIDGNRIPSNLPCSADWIIRGDQTEPCISAASILAKTHRDALLLELDTLYPDYGFRQHKGYGTRQHLAALEQFGPTPVHRRDFAPVRRLL